MRTNSTTQPTQRLIYALVVVFACLSHGLTAQQDSLWQQAPQISIAGFADAYYVFDFNQPVGDSRQLFLYNHNRHNELNLNLALLKLGVSHAKYRANIALQAGTYAVDNYAAEPDMLKSIFEANVGIALNKKNNLWLDAGVFPSHLGFESAISIDNMTLTRSLVAENSPYFLSGAKLTFSPSERIEMAGLITNGWQRIQRLPGNSLPSFGTQVKYTAPDKITLNWSTFVGTDHPDIARRIRIFNNFYGQFQVSDRFGFIAGFDFGLQQISPQSQLYHHWYGPTLIAQYAISQSLKTALRVEYYRDDDRVIIQSLSGFQTTGASLNLDYTPVPNVACRIEGRYMHGRDFVVEEEMFLVDYNFILAASIAVKFSETLGRGN